MSIREHMVADAEKWTAERRQFYSPGGSGGDYAAWVVVDSNGAVRGECDRESDAVLLARAPEMLAMLRRVRAGWPENWGLMLQQLVAGIDQDRDLAEASERKADGNGK